MDEATAIRVRDAISRGNIQIGYNVEILEGPDMNSTPDWYEPEEGDFVVSFLPHELKFEDYELLDDMLMYIPARVYNSGKMFIISIPENHPYFEETLLGDIRREKFE